PTSPISPPSPTRRSSDLEGVGDEAHVLDDGDRVAVTHRQPGRLLPSVLQRVQAGIGELGHRLAGGVDAEDATEISRCSTEGRSRDRKSTRLNSSHQIISY